MVTWLLAVKNGMPYLPETLASIEAQTYPDWEIIAWDNGSSDGTVEELQRWIPARLPGRVVADRPCASLGVSRAELVSLAATELCAWTDADDLSLPTRLEEQVAFLEAHPEIALVGGQCDRIDAHGAPIGPRRDLPQRHDDLVHALLSNSPLWQPSVLFRRRAIAEAGNYRDVGAINVEDYDLWLRLARFHRLANLSQVVLKYRVHPSSTTIQALSLGRLAQAADDCFCRQAPGLFGCTEEEARLLRTRQLRCALPLLWRICRFLEKTQGLPAWARLRSASFRDSAHQMLGDRDFITWAALALLAPGLAAKVWGLGVAGAIFLRCLGLNSAAASMRKFGRARGRLR